MSDSQDREIATAAQIASMEAKIDMLMDLVEKGQQDTHRRIDDLRHAFEKRLETNESRIATLEANERQTAIKAAAFGAASSAATTVFMDLLKGLFKH